MDTHRAHRVVASLYGRLRASAVLSGPFLAGVVVSALISFTIPIRAQSTSNLREHWAAKAKRVDVQKRFTRAKCPVWTAGPILVVTLTRVSPRALDDDNLRGALKSVRDAIAQWLRIDDASPLVHWMYQQEKGAPGVRIEVVQPIELMQRGAEASP